MVAPRRRRVLKVCLLSVTVRGIICLYGARSKWLRAFTVRWLTPAGVCTFCHVGDAGCASIRPTPLCFINLCVQKKWRNWEFQCKGGECETGESRQGIDIDLRWGALSSQALIGRRGGLPAKNRVLSLFGQNCCK